MSRPSKIVSTPDLRVYRRSMLWLAGLGLLPPLAFTGLISLQRENTARDKASALPEALPPTPLVHNFRDLAGAPHAPYRTIHGRPLRRGVIYRSGWLGAHALSEDWFASRGIKAVYDLRSPPVRHQHPEQIPEGIDYLPMHLAEKPLITTPPATNADTAQQQQQQQDARLRLSNTVEGHMRLLVATPTIRMRTAELLTQLSAGEGAKVIHCTHGEHLTGWITALLHTIVELPHESLMHDFMLSNAQIPQRASADASAPVVRASALQAAIYEANARYGTLQRFISDGLQLSTDTQQRLKAQLLV